MTSELIFVYNANSGLFNAAINHAHKLISPQTYQCNLCALTYEKLNPSMNKKWKHFLQNLPYKTTFIYKDQFQKQHPNLKSTTLPAVFIKTKTTLKLLITSQEINTQKNLNDLINLVKQKTTPKNPVVSCA